MCKVFNQQLDNKDISGVCKYGYGRIGRFVSLAGVTVVALMLSGCAGPMAETQQQKLHEMILATYQRQVNSIKGSQPIVLSPVQDAYQKSLSPKKIHQLDQISGVQSYSNQPLNLGRNLMGQRQQHTVSLSLDRVVHLSVKNNLALQGGRLVPQIAQTKVKQAAAKFDAMFFTKVGNKLLDTPRPPGYVIGQTGDQQSKQFRLTTGIQKPLETGGKITLQTDVIRQEFNPSSFVVNHYYTSDVMLRISQPLLRGFGSDVNRAKIVLAHNNQRSQVQKFRARIVKIVTKVVQTYWAIALYERQLKIGRQLIKRIEGDRQRLLRRTNFDATTVQVAQATSYLETSRANQVRRREKLRLASNHLKRLINDPALPQSGPTLVLAATEPIKTAVQFNLLDSLTTALRHRPQLQVAVEQIKDAAVRQRVAENGLLPVLNISAAIRYNGMDTDSGTAAYNNLSDGDYIDYILSGQFKMPLGNRKPKARYQQRRLEYQQAIIAYRFGAQKVVGDVKAVLGHLSAAFQLIAVTSAARRAAADNLRALHVQEKAGAALTPEFLVDLKLNAEQRLAQAQIAQAKAVTQYNDAISRMYRATGTLLSHYRIDFPQDKK